MTDFGSYLLLRLVERSIGPGGPKAPVPAQRGLQVVEAAEKRRFLALIGSRYGLAVLLNAGSGLADLQQHPVAAALLCAADSQDLLDRWRRLERFNHSKHRVEVQEVGERGLTLRHISLDGSQPTPEEDALIVGVLAHLFVLRGAKGLSVELCSGPLTYEIFRGGRAVIPLAWPRGAVWRLQYEAWTAPTEPDLVQGGSPVEDVRSVLASDLARCWRLEELVARLHQPRRSLQRMLEPNGGFSEILNEVRAAAAAVLLLETALPIAHIGFTCGYADQAHFTRSLKRRVGMPPSAFRAAFARQGSSPPRSSLSEATL